MKFSHLYEELKLLDICKPVSPEEAKRRDTEWQELKMLELIEALPKTKLADGTWHVHSDINLKHYPLYTLQGLNVSIVDGDFDCSWTFLTSLEGGPTKVKSFACIANDLTSLISAPTTVDGNFLCNSNNLTSLVGSPDSVTGDFTCYNSNFTTLEGAPKYVGDTFNCSSCKLTSLKGAPSKVGKNFYCYNNMLITLDGAPKEVGFNFVCSDNPMQFTRDDVRALCDVKGKIVV